MKTTFKLHLACLALACLALVFLAFPSPSRAETEKRIAFVVGNAAYQAGQLATPVNDAGLIAQEAWKASPYDHADRQCPGTVVPRGQWRLASTRASDEKPTARVLVQARGPRSIVQFEAGDIVFLDAR